MNITKILYKVFNFAKQIPIDDSSKIVLISDCHRGEGSWADSLSKNQNIYFSALHHYYSENYTYIELGDGDELWENKDINEIMHNHSNVFWMLSKFYRNDRLYFIYGNHDMVKRNPKYIRKNLNRYYDEREKKFFPVFKNLRVHEALVLKYKDTSNKILLLHGHQVDFLNSRLWQLSRFLVRYLWRPLELYGANDPTRAAKNYKKMNSVAKHLDQWANKEKIMVIAGHTHKPVFAQAGKSLYFNDGSCVHPRCITCIEISGGDIRLVKWSVKTRGDGTLYVGRDVLAGPEKIDNYFK